MYEASVFPTGTTKPRKSTKNDEDHEKEFFVQSFLRALRGSSWIFVFSWLHLFFLQSAAVSTIGDGRRIILCRSAPAGTIGYTESSCSTWKSISAARFRRRAASTAPATSPRFVTVVAAMPNASASFAKFGPPIGVAA